MDVDKRAAVIIWIEWLELLSPQHGSITHGTSKREEQVKDSISCHVTPILQNQSNGVQGDANGLLRPGSSRKLRMFVLIPP